MTDMINRILNPDQTIVELHDWGRGKPNGIATTNANNKLVQQWDNLNYATQIKAPAPYTNTHNLAQWIFLMFTGGLNG